MKRVVLISMLLALIAALVSCGKGSSTTTTSLLTVSPTSTTLATGSTVQFTASTGGTTTTGVFWEVNGAVGGDLTNGTISTAGLYIAPGTVPSKATVTVTAVSTSDSTQTASAQVTITQGTAVTISIAPPISVSVPASHTHQFVATVANTANTAVIWQVNSVTGGESTDGTIDSTGLYTAPAAVPATPTVTITALAQADATKTTTASVTILPFSFVSVAPATVVLPAGGQQSFTATANGQSVDVTWSLSCHASSADACGAISSTGVFTAPLSPPPGADVTITATATSGAFNPGGAVATVQFANGSLSGKYAFSFSGQNATGALTAAGSITFDGNGNVTGGTEDVNNSGSSTSGITGGSYHVGTDGRGTATVQTSAGTTAWQFALVNHSHAFAIRSGANSGTASGTLDLQDATQFNSSSVKGNYALSLGGSNAGGAASSLALAGAVTADGAGTLSQGLLDVNNAGDVKSALALTGAYTAPSSSGRGTLTLSSSFGTQNFAYYVVDAAHLKLMGTDAPQMVSGDLFKQPAGPFTNASSNGPFAFVLAGSTAGHPLGLGGVFALDGAGNFSRGVADINDNGNWQSGMTLSGTYTVTDATTGRATAAVNVNGTALQYVFYPRSGGLNFLEADTLHVASGTAYAQSGSSFTNASLQGNFALSLTGTDFTSNPGEEDIAGQLVPNGGSALTGILDINDGTATSRATAVNGTYLVTSFAGRGTATLQTGSATLSTAGFNLYIVNTGQVLFLESDSNRVLVGIMQSQ